MPGEVFFLPHGGIDLTTTAWSPWELYILHFGKDNGILHTGLMANSLIK